VTLELGYPLIEGLTVICELVKKDRLRLRMPVLDAISADVV
jgi:hypothetical protein